MARPGEPPSATTPAWGDPDLYRLPDGMTERARRYQRERAADRWPLPASWPTPASTPAHRRSPARSIKSALIAVDPQQLASEVSTPRQLVDRLG